MKIKKEYIKKILKRNISIAQKILTISFLNRNFAGDNLEVWSEIERVFPSSRKEVRFQSLFLYPIEKVYHKYNHTDFFKYFKEVIKIPAPILILTNKFFARSPYREYYISLRMGDRNDYMVRIYDQGLPNVDDGVFEEITEFKFDLLKDNLVDVLMNFDRRINSILHEVWATSEKDLLSKVKVYEIEIWKRY